MRIVGRIRGNGRQLDRALLRQRLQNGGVALPRGQPPRLDGVYILQLREQEGGDHFRRQIG